MLDSNVTLVSKQIQKTILAVKGAARALPRSINGSDDAQSAVSQEFSVLREISRAQPLALERTEGQLRSSGVLAEVLETLSHLSSQVLGAQQDETYEWQSSEAMHQLESINRVFAYVETMYDEKEDDETEE
ncbi:MAG: hypothetical protein EOO38_31615 [Cytophagaceae bacterium]|nr:MAG: hypothetical protein EOO38_31615 [Cytophagaceae bacterium]